MATEKVGIYRKYHEQVPKDKCGKPLPKGEWPKKRSFRWAVRWFGSEGKRYSKSFETRKEAEVFANKKQTDVRNKKSDPPPNITLLAYCREHKELMQGNIAPKTLYMHLTSLKLLAKSVGWERQLNKITIKDIERFRASRLKTAIVAATANREIKTLRRIFNLAIIRAYLPKDANPCKGLPMLKVGSKHNKYVKPEEFRNIYDNAPDSLWRAFLVTVYTTGLRLREAINLTWQDVDFDTCELHVTRKKRESFVQAWTPKDHEMRTIPLPEQAVGLLATWQSVAPEECPYVFMDQGRWGYYRRQVELGRWVSDRDLVNNVLRRFKTLCRKAKVSPYTIHDMRRSCLNNWAKHLPIHVVKELAGHSDIKTTQQFYLSVQPEDISRAQKVQELVVGKIPENDMTDPKLTHSTEKRSFPGKRGFLQKM